MLVEEMVTEGADRIDMGRNTAWYHHGAWKPRFVSGYESILCSRPYLEWKVRGRTVRLPNVELRQGYHVQGLLTDASRARVKEVRFEGPAGEETLEADRHRSRCMDRMPHAPGARTPVDDARMDNAA